MANKNRIIIYCRLAYFNCWKPVQIYGKQNYSLVALISKEDHDTIRRIHTMIEDVKQQSVNRWGNSLLTSCKSPVHDGDIERSQNPVFHGCYYLNAKCRDQPQIVDQNVQPITDPSLIYSGCYANISLIFYPYNFGSNNRGIGVWLGNVQLVHSGQRIISRITAKDEFSPVAFDDLIEVKEYETGPGTPLVS